MSRLSSTELERHVGQIRARLELVTARVERVEKLSSERVSRDVHSLQRDMVRVAALAERGGAVKDHLNKLTRRVDELEGGAKASNEVVAIGARVSRLAQQAEDGTDRLAARVDALAETMDEVVSKLAALTERIEDLVAPQAAAPPEGRDDLRRIKGIGPKYEKALHAAGIHRWAQIAALGDEEIAEVASQIDVKPERIRKAGWVAKARALLDE